MLINDEMLNELQQEALASPRLRIHRDMRNSSEDTSQRMLNALEIGTILPIHRNPMSSETLVLLRGKIDVMFYNDRGEEIQRYRLDSNIGTYAVNIPIGQWHNLEVLESGTAIFEAKDGKYEPLGPEDILEK